MHFVVVINSTTAIENVQREPSFPFVLQTNQLTGNFFDFFAHLNNSIWTKYKNTNDFLMHFIALKSFVYHRGIQ